MELKQLIERLKAVQSDGNPHPCPRCGLRVAHTRTAISRMADVYICDQCGQDEALRAAEGPDYELQLRDWNYAAAIKELEPEKSGEADQMFEIDAALHVKVTGEDIDDIMLTALEGGITPWCYKAEVVGGVYLGGDASEQISRGGSLMLFDRESSDKWELTRDKLLAGLKMYVENGGARIVFDDGLDTGEIDSDAADCIIQYALFGELVYG